MGGLRVDVSGCAVPEQISRCQMAILCLRVCVSAPRLLQPVKDCEPGGTNAYLLLLARCNV